MSGGGGGGFDLVVIGAGSAGFSAAIKGAELGARVALVGHGTIGGTCVNVGCVPSKTLIRAAEALQGGEAAKRFAGIRGRLELADWGALQAQKDELVDGLRQAKYRDLLPEYDGITYVKGPAHLDGDGVAVNGDRLIPRGTIIATGAHAALPPIPGLESLPCLDSTAALALERLPASMVVIGGGYVGCELAQLFARLGVGVTLLCRSRLLPEGEPEVSEALADCFRAEGIDVHCGVDYDRVGRTATGVAIALRAGSSHTIIECETLLVAAGRQPNTAGLGLTAAGVALTTDGGVLVDDHMRTTRAGTYAAGDVTGRHMFVYMAAHGGGIAAENALGGTGRCYDASAMPAVAFTDPQAASVGMTEARALGLGIAVRTSVLPLEYLPRALAARDTRGLIKLVAEAGTGRLLGAHILAPEGGDSIQTAALAIHQGLSVGALAQMIFPYLTTVEGLKLAAQGFEKDVSKLSCCAG